MGNESHEEPSSLPAPALQAHTLGASVAQHRRFLGLRRRESPNQRYETHVRTVFLLLFEQLVGKHDQFNSMLQLGATALRRGMVNHSKEAGAVQCKAAEVAHASEEGSFQALSFLFTSSKSLLSMCRNFSKA